MRLTPSQQYPYGSRCSDVTSHLLTYYTHCYSFIDLLIWNRIERLNDSSFHICNDLCKDGNDVEEPVTPPYGPER